MDMKLWRFAFYLDNMAIITAVLSILLPMSQFFPSFDRRCHWGLTFRSQYPSSVLGAGSHLVMSWGLKMLSLPVTMERQHGVRTLDSTPFIAFNLGYCNSPSLLGLGLWLILYPNRWCANQVGLGVTSTTSDCYVGLRVALSLSSLKVQNVTWSATVAFCGNEIW